MKFSLSSVALLSAAGANARAIAQYAREVDASTAAATSYDFIVIGGGTGGLTVADRLTEDPKTKVLVVEYAEFDKGDDTIYVPGSYLPVPYLWLGLVTTPQEALNNKVYNVPIGRVVGGGSGVNAMMFFRGTKADYKLWGDMGNRGWDWNSLLPYFKKSETFNKPDPAFAKKYNISWDDSVHGTSGPVQASFSNWDWPSSQNWWNGAMAAGIGAAKDPNDGESQGLYWLVRAKDPKTQTRSWSKTAHYDRVKTRSNYHIITNSAVSKVILEGAGPEKRAVGVEFVNRASMVKSTVRASKEIILSAGAVHSPKVLQLSGIGPRALLDKHGIKTLVDLPGVGMNLQDHVAVKVGYNYTSHIEPNLLTLQNNATWDKEMRKQYDETKTGPYTLVRGTGNNMLKVPLKTITSKATFNKIVALAKSQKAKDIYPKDIHPEVLRGYQSQREKMINDFSLETTGIGSLAWNTGSETTIYFIKPLSRGSVSIASTDPLQNPLVNYRTVTDPTDLQNLLALYRKNREIMATKEMQALGPIETRPAAGKESDADIIQAIKDSLEPSNAHQCCTLAMQKRNEGGVVNDQLLVYGVKGLSVADASFWPVNLAGAPHATIYAAAERAADLIKARHKIKTCPPKKRSL